MSNAPTAKEIRLYCDGELSLPEAAAIEAKLREHPDAAALAAFERDLKEKVAAALTDGSAPPADLRDRVRAALAADAGVAGRIGEPTRTSAPHRAWWMAPLHANAFAVAASLILVAGAVLFGIFGQPIDAWRNREVLDIAAEAAAAVADEHISATARPHDEMAAWARYHSPEVAARELGQYLGESGCVYDLRDAGYTFVGGNRCDVPQCERGCHLVYERSGGSGIATLHVVPRPPLLTAKRTAGLDALPLPTEKIPRGSNCRMDVLVWTHGDRCYFLSVCVARDAEKIALVMQKEQLAGSDP